MNKSLSAAIDKIENEYNGRIISAEFNGSKATIEYLLPDDNEPKIMKIEGINKNDY